MESQRRYPRTLDEAFPHGPRYGCAIERPAARAYSRAWWVCMGIIAMLTVVLCWGGA